MRKTILIAALAAAIGVPSTVPAAEPIGEKLQAYIGCINDFSGPAYAARKRYFSWTDQSGPTGAEKLVYGTYTISDPGKCGKEVAAANAAAPHDQDLEAAGTAYVESLTALAPVLKEANDYYHQENYKDDGMAKGKALHPKLVAAWANFEAADDKLRAIVEKLNDAAEEQELAEVESKEGRGLHFLSLDIMATAKKALRIELEADEPEPDKIQPALDNLDKAIQEYEQYADAHKDELATKFSVSQIQRTSKEFALAARKFMRRVRDKTPYSHGEEMMLSSGAGWTVEGSPAAVNKTYNELVDAFNHAH